MIWTVSILPLISSSSSLLCKLLGTIPTTTTKIGITVTFMFDCSFNCLARSKYLSIFSLLLFSLWFAETAKSIRYFDRYYFTSWEFCHPVLAGSLPVESPWVSRSILSILADLSCAIFRKVSILPLITSASSLFAKPLGIIPSTPTTISITVTFMFHIFFVLWQDPSTFLSLRFLYCVFCRHSKIHRAESLIFVNTWSGLPGIPNGISKSKEFDAFHSPE